jgi:hypothetical protein
MTFFIVMIVMFVSSLFSEQKIQIVSMLSGTQMTGILYDFLKKILSEKCIEKGIMYYV